MIRADTRLHPQVRGFSMRIRSILLLVCSFLISASPASTVENPETHDLIRVNISNQQQAITLQSLGLDIVKTSPDGAVFIVTHDNDLSTLTREGFEYEILIRDLETYYEKRLLADPAFGNGVWPYGSMGGYYTYSEIGDELDAWATAYPDLITTKTSIGTTIEGRDIWAVKISDNPDQDEEEPEVYYDSLIHPREVMGLMTVFYYMKNLLEGYGYDPEITHLVNNREIWFVPVHNPDGHVYNEQTNPDGGGLWRKNRRHNGGGIYGVDLARNYSFQWGYDNIGSSPDPNSIAYRGTGPFSEPEAQVIRDFIMSRPIVTSWNTHTFTNVYLCPFSYDYVLPYGDDWPIFQEWLEDISVENGYPAGPSPLTIGYVANGTPLDWQYAEEGIFCIAPEIGTWDDFFWPPESRIVPLAEENQLACRYWSWVAGSYADMVDYTLADDNGDGLFNPGEPVDLILTLRNKGLEGTVTDVTASISSSSPHVTITDNTHNFGVIPSLTDADNGGNPMTLELDDATPYGEVITIDVEISFDGYTHTRSINLVCGVPEIIYAADMETNPGWTVGDTGDDATTGIWERGNPVGTEYGTLQAQPEDDHTPAPGSRCFVTGNGSTYPDADDVDNGKTTLKTSIFDLTGIENASVSYWRWYADLGPYNNNDLFTVDISSNGGIDWVNAETLDHTVNSWEEVSFKVGDFVTPGDEMMMRFVARDDPDDSICEAGIDDFTVKTYDLPLSLVLSGPPAIGTSVDVIVDSPSDEGLRYFMAASLSTYPVTSIGDRYMPLNYDRLAEISMDPSNPIFEDFFGLLNESGYSSAPTIVVPDNENLVGRTVYIAALTLNPPGHEQRVKNISAPLTITIE
jgi:hypothetical protein